MVQAAVADAKAVRVMAKVAVIVAAVIVAFGVFLP
jgi:hypothetical protein